MGKAWEIAMSSDEEDENEETGEENIFVELKDLKKSQEYNDGDGDVNYKKDDFDFDEEDDDMDHEEQTDDEEPMDDENDGMQKNIKSKHAFH